MRATGFADGILRDLQQGVRQLRRSPVFTLVSILTLAFGLGGSIALFTAVNAVLFRPLPGRDTAALHAIFTSNSRGGLYGATSLADFRTFTDAAPELFAGACASAPVRANLIADAQPRALDGAVINGGCFDTLRVRAHRGRTLAAADDDQRASAASVVISYALWRGAFRADEAIVGRAVLLSGLPAVIVGVAEPGFAGVSFDGGADFWAPPPLAPALMTTPSIAAARGQRRFRVLVRPAEGVSAAQVQSRLAAVAAQLRTADPASWTDERGATRAVTVVPELQARFAGSQGAAVGIGLSALGAIALLVALACINLATMMLARGTGRTHELSVRLALGASRGRLLRQLAVESLLLSAAGVVCGLLVLAVALRLFDVYRPAEVPALNLAIDWRVAVFALGMTLATPVLFGITPGAHALRLAIAEGLKGRSVMVRRGELRAGPRELLLAVQAAAACALLIAATLFTHALVAGRARDHDPRAEQIAVVPVDVETAAATPGEAQRLSERLLQAAGRLPEVERVTASAFVPLTGSYMTFSVAGDRAEAQDTVIDGNVVAPGYFELLGIAVQAGRTFDGRDHARAPRVAIVSASLAQRLWGSAPAVGRTLRVDEEAREVAGVVADVPYRGDPGAAQPVIYLPLAQAARTRLVVHAHTRDRGSAVIAIDRALRAVDARVLVGPAATLAQYRDRARIGAQVVQSVGYGAGLLQLGLALMATWGLVAYAVTRRTAEIGVRRALGASEGRILSLVMRSSLLTVGAGAIVGGAAGAVATRMLHAEFLGLAPLDLSTVGPALLLFLLVVAAGAWLPARRAVAIEPAAALRQL